ncbi:nuclear transcription factor Y, gamma [Entomortierella parvispora]|uniref:Nuclear transcription factor Y, gamma n=1 Tax=Entomortierella parvispora TaxID=205924 RepID=A0A9P3HFQ0_9FUNG|nr:nuclear transcription factor Y, gamma [Entomortierella parvispora]
MSHQRQDSTGSAYDPAVAAQYHQLQQQQQHHHPLHQQHPQQHHQPYNIMPPMGHAPPPPLQHHHDPSIAHQQPMQQAHLHLLQSFWMNQMHEVENVPQDFKLHHLPLARIKKVMKTDEDVKAKMISAEAPMLFDKGCEIFITELTIRAWIHAEENKRRTLQRSDIAAAITKTDMFDFLIDIVPREEFKMGKESKAAAAAAATALGEHRRSQESFPSIGSNTSAGVVAPGLHPAGLEGYPYAYGMLEGSYMPAGGPMDPYQQQQQQQQLQLQYMRAQMAQQQGQAPSHPQQPHHSQQQPHAQQQQHFEFQPHDGDGGGGPGGSSQPPLPTSDSSWAPL